MSGIKMSIDGIPALEKELQRLNSVRFDAVAELQANEMVDRATASKNPAVGGTPYVTGELMQAVNMYGKGADSEVGYTKEYAPHVEYGHRTIGGGFVQGQHFLQKNVDIQRPIYRQDLQKAIKKG